MLDTKRGLPPTYAPPDLTATDEAGFEDKDPDGHSFLVRGFLIPDLHDLRKAAAANGTPIGIQAAFRSYAHQASLFNDRVKEFGLHTALERTARPGHSEHQLGTTIDFKTAGAPDVTTAWASTPTGRWMRQNAWRFGFVLSYPKGRTGVTCYAYEPWHLRYFGRAAAAEIQMSHLTVRQYLWNEESEPES